jgi:hypothetical protein
MLSFYHAIRYVPMLLKNKPHRDIDIKMFNIAVFAIETLKFCCLINLNLEAFANYSFANGLRIFFGRPSSRQEPFFILAFAQCLAESF